MDNKLRISLVQADIAWENKSVNLENYHHLLQELSGRTDLAVLPEMFSTGFSMQCNHLAEMNDGETVSSVKAWSAGFGFAIAGSFLAKDEQERIYNRGFFITPEGTSYFYDKRHLFRMGNEHDVFTQGEKQLVINYKGWNIFLIVCYDLRFPVWTRNVNNAYDLMICSANWPEVRNSVWETLLKARAIENQAYVCGVNRIGADGNGLMHQGNSMLLNPKGEMLSEIHLNTISADTYIIDKGALEYFREKFPAWKDADRFEIFY